jgi:hypothetical protein
MDCNRLSGKVEMIGGMQKEGDSLPDYLGREKRVKC